MKLMTLSAPAWLLPNIGFESNRQILKRCAYDRRLAQRFGVLFPTSKGGVGAWSNAFLGCVDGGGIINGIGYSTLAVATALVTIGMALCVAWGPGSELWQPVTCFLCGAFALIPYAGMVRWETRVRKAFAKCHADLFWQLCSKYEGSYGWSRFLNSALTDLGFMDKESRYRIIHELQQQRDKGIPVLECHVDWIDFLRKRHLNSLKSETQHVQLPSSAPDPLTGIPLKDAAIMESKLQTAMR